MGFRTHIECRKTLAKIRFHRGEVLLDQTLEAGQQLRCVALGLGDAPAAGATLTNAASP
jgi:hypothetical protein